MKSARSLFLIGLAALISAEAAALEGAEYVRFEVDGKTYEAPIPNNKTRDDFYYAKKAIAGDRLAREILLGGRQKRYFFIGDVGVTRWLVITLDGQEIIEN